MSQFRGGKASRKTGRRSRCDRTKFKPIRAGVASFGAHPSLFIINTGLTLFAPT